MTTRLSNSVIVKAPAAAAWAFVSDPRRMAQVQGNSSVRLLNGAWDEVGSRYLVTTKAGWQTADVLFEIVRFEDGRLMETRMDASQGTMRSLAQVEPLPDGRCVVIFQGETEWYSGIGTWIPWLMTMLFARQTMRGLMDQMRDLIEADAVVPDSSPGPDAAESHLGEEW